MESIKNIAVKRAVPRFTEDQELKSTVVWEEDLFNLFLTGKPGVGKTFKAKKLLQDAIDKWNSFRATRAVPATYSEGKELYKFYTCSELMMYSRLATKQIQLYEECIRYKGLVLDDLGVGKHSDFIPDIIYMIIDKRLTLEKPTIVTSNLKLQEISDLIDDRLASRLATYQYLELEGEDKRLIINK